MVKLPHWPIPYKTSHIKLGLERVKEGLHNVGNPHLKLPPVIHVAGTNGKGSTLAFIQATLEEQGYKVHKYSSPHITEFNERIVLSGKNISDEYLHEMAEEVRLACGDLPLTFFEGTTIIAMLAFSRVPADVVLLETGMGGRLDATNVIDEPLLNIITPISYDHMEYLGKNLSEIATEKAGILKNGARAVISWQYAESMQPLMRKCVEVSVEPFLHGRDWDFTRTAEGFNFIDCNSEIAIKLPNPSLAGIHQYLNAATAVASILSIRDILPVDITNIAKGIASAKWPARLEKIKGGVIFSQLANDDELWVDGAHNEEGAKMLAAHIKNEWHDMPNIMIHGRTGERDIAGFLEPFKGIITEVNTVRVASEPKPECPHKIAKIANELGFKALAHESILDAVKKIKSKHTSPMRIIICGSLYLAGDVSLAKSL